MYGTDQEFYKNWSTYPFYNLTGYIFSFIRGINLSKNKFGAAVGEKLGVNKFLKNKKDITMELDSNCHSVFLLYYHLVLVVKYRRNVFDDTISEFAKDMFVRIGVPYHITLVQWNHDKDHVDIMFKAHPKTELTKFINAYKSASSRIIKKEFPHIRKYLWQEMFWSKSFCLLTTGGAPIEVIKKYIEEQGQKSK